jgi:hypothetical protein
MKILIIYPNMNLQEQISRILKEDSNIPFVILRRVTPEDIEEAFEFALDRMGYMMENPNSFIYKKKETTLRASMPNQHLK